VIGTQRPDVDAPLKLALSFAWSPAQKTPRHSWGHGNGRPNQTIFKIFPFKGLLNNLYLHYDQQKNLPPDYNEAPLTLLSKK
jgi:hypothetical protein